MIRAGVHSDSIIVLELRACAQAPVLHVAECLTVLLLSTPSVPSLVPSTHTQELLYGLCLGAPLAHMGHA